MASLPNRRLCTEQKRLEIANGALRERVAVLCREPNGEPGVDPATAPFVSSILHAKVSVGYA